jgi:hypothetical protein
LIYLLDIIITYKYQAIKINFKGEYMVVTICNPSSPEAEAEGSRVGGQPELHREFQTSLGYIVRPHFKTRQNKTKQNKTKQNKKHPGASGSRL